MNDPEFRKTYSSLLLTAHPSIIASVVEAVPGLKAPAASKSRVEGGPRAAAFGSQPRAIPPHLLNRKVEVAEVALPSTVEAAVVTGSHLGQCGQIPARAQLETLRIDDKMSGQSEWR